MANEEDDDGIEILEDEDDDDMPVVQVDAHGSITTSTPCAASTTNGSTFPPFLLMDLHADIIADIKGKNPKRILNQLRRQYYNLDMMWVRCLHLQLPQAPRCNWNINNMMEHMLHE